MTSENILKQVAAKVSGCDVEDVNEERYDCYGLKVFSANGEEYAIGNDEEADEAVKENIKNSLWAFNANFIIDHSKVKYSSELEKSLREMQSKLCESANDLVEALIKDLDKFVEDAISADGRGRFLSSYDSEELEIEIEGEMFFAYRQN